MPSDLSAAVDRYSRSTWEAISPPTRQEVETLRVEVIRAAIIALIEEQLMQINDDRRRLAHLERQLGRIKGALTLAAPMQEVE